MTNIWNTIPELANKILSKTCKLTTLTNEGFQGRELAISVAKYHLHIMRAFTSYSKGTESALHHTDRSSGFFTNDTATSMRIRPHLM